MKKYIKIIAVAGVLFPGIAFAQLSKNATCEEQGYINTALECTTMKKEALKCPSDETKLYCAVEKTCTASGYLSSCGAGLTGVPIKVGDLDCFSECKCTNYWDYTNCKIQPSGTSISYTGILSGSTCVKDGVTKYQYCDTCTTLKNSGYTVFAWSQDFQKYCGHNGGIGVCSVAGSMTVLCDQYNPTNASICHGGTVSSSSPYYCKS